MSPDLSLSILFDQYGAPDVLRAKRLPVPSPGKNEVLICQTCIGVNYIDTYHRSGLYPQDRFPAHLGVEATGTVEAIGPNVRQLRPGMRVAYAGGTPGAYAERRVMPAKRVIRIPDSLDDETVAASLLKGMTVEYLVERAVKLHSGDTVLWHAAAGGVGLIACQWLRSLGVNVIGTVGSEVKARVAKRAGCSHTIIYTKEDVLERVKSITQGKMVPVVFDSVGKDTFLTSARCLQRRGTLVSFGNASGKPEPFEPKLLADLGSLFVTRPVLGDYTSTRKELETSAQRVFDQLERGLIKAQISHRWPLHGAESAHLAMESRQTTGSSILHTKWHAAAST
jgi:NADPH:quinone reductase